MLLKRCLSLEMASSENLPEEEMDRVCAYVLRNKRAVLLRELPEVKDLLRDSRLSPLFTHYERGEVCGSGLPTERAEKFIRGIEIRGGPAYALFITVLKDFRPSLVKKLNECAKEWSRRASEELPVNCVPSEL